MHLKFNFSLKISNLILRSQITTWLGFHHRTKFQSISVVEFPPWQMLTGYGLPPPCFHQCTCDFERKQSTVYISGESPKGANFVSYKHLFLDFIRLFIDFKTTDTHLNYSLLFLILYTDILFVILHSWSHSYWIEY